MSLIPGGPLSYPVTSLAGVPYLHQTRAPTTHDGQGWPLGSVWVDFPALDAYMLVGNAQSVFTWVKIGGNEGALEHFTIPGGTIITPDVNNNINIEQGGGVTITGSGNTYTISSAGGHGLTWSIVTGATQIEDDNGYFSNGGSQVDFTLPATPSIGASFAIYSMNANGFSISGGAGQQIRLGNMISTATTGSLVSTAIGDGLQVVCVNSLLFMVTAVVGNITIV